MWEEYAKAHNKSTTELTQSEKVQAEINGIMKETIAQTGDLAKMGDSLIGTQAQTAQNMKELATGFGEAMAPTVGLIEGVKSGVVEMLKSIIELSPEATAGITSAGVAITGLVAAAKGAELLGELTKKLKDMSNAGKLFGMSFTGAMGIIGALSVGIGIISAVVTAVERAKQAEQERLKTLSQNAKESRNNAKELKELADRYDELSQKAQKSVEDIKEMEGIEGTLSNKFNVIGGYVDTLTGKYISLADAAREAAKAQLEASLKNEKEVYESKLKGIQDRLQWQQDDYNAYRATSKSAGRSFKFVELNFEEFYKKNNLGDNLKNYMAELGKDSIDILRGEMEANGTKISDYAYNTGMSVAESFIKGQEVKSQEQGIEVLNQAKEIWASAVNSDAIGGLEQKITTIEGIKQKLISNIEITDEEKAHFSEAYKGLYDDVDKFVDGIQGLSDEQKDEIMNNFLAGLDEQFRLFTEITEKGKADGISNGVTDAEIDSITDAIDKNNVKLREQAEELEFNKGKAEKLKQAGEGAFDPLTASSTEASRELGNMDVEIDRLTSDINQFENTGKKIRSINKLSNDFRKGKIDANKFQSEMKKLGFENVKTADQADELSKSLKDKLAGSLEQTKSRVIEALDTLTSLKANSNIQGEVRVQTEAAEAKLKGLIGLLNAVLALMGMAGVGSGKASGGGGGGGGKKQSAYQKAIADMEHSKKIGKTDLYGELGTLLAIQKSHNKLTEEESRDLAERIYAVRKAIHEKELQDDYDLIEHKKALNQISTEQEVQMLEQMAQKHWFTNEERMEYDRKLYEARERLRREKEEKLTGIGEGLVEALRRQYDKLREEEMKALDESKEAFDNWADGRIKALEKQIELIDKLNKQEDEEAKSAKELRKIAQLKEAYNFEHDEYNRAKIAEQIAQEEEKRAERLRKKENDDKKQALRDEIKNIQEQKNEQRKSMDSQRKEIEERYKGLTEQLSLEAEARRMIMEKSQKEIVDTIAKYAPEYDALDRSLGEKWLSGFESSVGNIFKYFDDFNKSLQGIQEGLASKALRTVDKFHSDRAEKSEVKNVTQNINFNQPIETPSQVAKRMKDAAEELVYI